MELRDKVVVVTGGASGIGTGLCRRFREEGVRGLVIADLNGDVAADLAAEVGGKSYALDVRDEAALAAMRELQPAVVLMDMNLPIMDGWTACAAAQNDSRLADIPITALTAHAMEEDKARALAAGCSDYATKPVDFPDLLSKISAHLNASH